MQYNDLIKIYADELNAKQELTNIIYTPGYMILRNGVKQGLLKNTHDKLMGAARNILVSRHPELQLEIQELDQRKQDNIFAK
jgi:hypothetical protein